MGMTSEVDRRKSFSFAYFNRPISRTESVWYINAERLHKQSSVVSGEYSEISAILVTPQDDKVFLTPSESFCQSLDNVQMECDVHPDSEEAFDEDTIVPPKLTALKCDSLAPPENQWFHGYLDRPDAEGLLNKQPPGSYIVRISIPSADQPTKYVLTVRTTIGFQHFKIKTLLGEYYISIYKFPTLGSIIGYFSQVSPLLAGLYLKSPLSPKRAVPREKRLKAKASYTAPSADECQDVLSFKKGDIFISDDILDGDDCRWIRGRKERSGEAGLIMRVLVQEVPQEDEDFYKYDWFHGRITEAMVLDTLRHEEEGRYVITTSGSIPNSYCMHIKTGGDIKTTQIFTRSDGRFMMGSQSHESLTQCIDSKGKSYANLSPVKRKNVRSVIYGSSTQNRPFIRDDKISARWRPSVAKSEWKHIKIYFEIDGENAVFLNTEKKGEKVEKVIPLKDCRVYEVDRSVFNVSYCLQVVVTGMNREIQGHFIDVDSFQKYQELLAKLQNEPYPIDNGPTRPGKRMKSLRVKVCQVDGPSSLNLPGPVYCQLGFDDSTVHRTQDAPTTRKLCWNSTLHCKHSNITKSSELRVKLCYTKNKKPCEIEAATVPLNDLHNMTFKTLYFSLNIKGQNNQAKLKLELYYRDHAVLQSTYYHGLLNELQKDNFKGIKLLRHVHWNPDSRETFASVLLTVYDKTKVHLMKELISEDIARHPDNDKGSLFRGNTITTALLVALLNAPPSCDYWDELFSRIVADMNMRVKARSEHPGGQGARTDKEDKERVLEDKERVLEALTQSVSDIPDTIRDVICHTLSEVGKKWPNDNSIQSAVLLTIMFVRFYCLRLSHPQDRDHCTMHQDTAGSLLKVAKSIKRKDVVRFLTTMQNSAPSSSLNVPTTQDMLSVEAADGAHLYHLIDSTLRSTDSTSPWIPPCEDDRVSLSALKLVLEHVDSIEQEVD